MWKALASLLAIILEMVRSSKKTPTERKEAEEKRIIDYRKDMRDNPDKRPPDTIH